MRSLSLAVLTALLMAAPAFANPAPGSPSDIERGFGMDESFDSPINPTTRDANGNRLIINGQIMTDTTLSGGIMDGFSSGAGSSQAIGNQLNVVTQGNWNTVIIQSNQINNGDISAIAQGDRK